VTTWLAGVDAPGEGPTVAVKDAVDVQGLPTTVGCVAFLAAPPAEADAECVAQIRAAGARIVGKTNLSELCWFAHGLNDVTGSPVNPLDGTRIPGGSSSGSAVAVAVGEVAVAIGTDTGGSVRVPAACCGVVGLKTTRGRISLAGVFPLARTFDTVGPIARDIAGVALGMRLMCPGFVVDTPGSSPRVARLTVPADAAIDAAVDAALGRTGWSVERVHVPWWDDAVRVATTILLAEGGAAHRHLLARSNEISAAALSVISRGAALDAADLASARSTWAHHDDRFRALLDRYDALALPVLAGAPPRVGQHEKVPVTRFTVPMNAAGLPALALPIPCSGFPASLQLVGRPGAEASLLGLGAVAETVSARPVGGGVPEAGGVPQAGGLLGAGG